MLYHLLSYTKGYKKEFFVAFTFLLIGTLGEIIGPLLVKVFIDDYFITRNLELQPLLTLGIAYISVHIIKVSVTYFQ